MTIKNVSLKLQSVFSRALAAGGFALVSLLATPGEAKAQGGQIVFDPTIFATVVKQLIEQEIARGLAENDLDLQESMAEYTELDHEAFDSEAYADYYDQVYAAINAGNGIGDLGATLETVQEAYEGLFPEAFDSASEEEIYETTSGVEYRPIRAMRNERKSIEKAHRTAAAVQDEVSQSTETYREIAEQAAASDGAAGPLAEAQVQATTGVGASVDRLALIAAAKAQQEAEQEANENTRRQIVLKENQLALESLSAPYGSVTKVPVPGSSAQ